VDTVVENHGIPWKSVKFCTVSLTTDNFLCSVRGSLKSGYNTDCLGNQFSTHNLTTNKTKPSYSIVLKEVNKFLVIMEMKICCCHLRTFSQDSSNQFISYCLFP